jgi:hypothetical protein
MASEQAGFRETFDDNRFLPDRCSKLVHRFKRQMRKIRTREHILADLATNHLERYVLKCGFAIDRIQHDYGIDVIMYTYRCSGEIEEGFVNIQLKASDNVRYDSRGIFVSTSIERAHLSHWLYEPFPVLLVMYDATIEKAYWVYVQRYFERMPSFSLANMKKTYSVRVPVRQVVDEEAIRKFAEFKQSVLSQLDGVISHA